MYINHIVGPSDWSSRGSLQILHSVTCWGPTSLEGAITTSIQWMVWTCCRRIERCQQLQSYNLFIKSALQKGAVVDATSASVQLAWCSIQGLRRGCTTEEHGRSFSQHPQGKLLFLSIMKTLNIPSGDLFGGCDSVSRIRYAVGFVTFSRSRKRDIDRIGKSEEDASLRANPYFGRSRLSNHHQVNEFV